jgi:hypothetical protein
MTIPQAGPASRSMCLPSIAIGSPGCSCLMRHS